MAAVVDERLQQRRQWRRWWLQWLQWQLPWVRLRLPQLLPLSLQQSAIVYAIPAIAGGGEATEKAAMGVIFSRWLQLLQLWLQCQRQWLQYCNGGCNNFNIGCNNICNRAGMAAIGPTIALFSFTMPQ